MSLPEAVLIDVPADPRFLNIISAAIEAYLDRVPEIDDRGTIIYNLKLAAQECCTNIIDHSYAEESGGRIGVCLTVLREPRRLVVEFHDTGISVEPATVTEPQLKVGSERGYGLFLMHELMDDVNYSQDERGNCWRLVKLL
ncbi:MAG TPA: ATP-binding protein [Anaerolineales bacterium]|nr:ATP-binding protein [Anaerolineales bacterium]